MLVMLVMLVLVLLVLVLLVLVLMLCWSEGHVVVGPLSFTKLTELTFSAMEKLGEKGAGLSHVHHELGIRAEKLGVALAEELTQLVRLLRRRRKVLLQQCDFVLRRLPLRRLLRQPRLERAQPSSPLFLRLGHRTRQAGARDAPRRLRRGRLRRGRLRRGRPHACRPHACRPNRRALGGPPRPVHAHARCGG